MRIHFADVVTDGDIAGVHYHYEVVIGVSGNNPIARALNKRITAAYSPEFFSAWHLHNAIEVGTFENLLPALYAQRENTAELRYARAMNLMSDRVETQFAQDAELFTQRVAGFKAADDPYAYQASQQRSFLKAPSAQP